MNVKIDLLADFCLAKLSKIRCIALVVVILLVTLALRLRVWTLGTLGGLPLGTGAINNSARLSDWIAE